MKIPSFALLFFVVWFSLTACTGERPDLAKEGKGEVSSAADSAPKQATQSAFSAPSKGSSSHFFEAVNNEKLPLNERRQALREFIDAQLSEKGSASELASLLGKVTSIALDDVEATQAFAGIWPFEDHSLVGHTLVLIRVRWEKSDHFDAVFISITGNVSADAFRRAMRGNSQEGLQNSAVAGCKLVLND